MPYLSMTLQTEINHPGDYKKCFGLDGPWERPDVSILQREVISVDSNMILYAVTYTVRKHHVIIGEVQHLLFLL